MICLLHRGSTHETDKEYFRKHFIIGGSDIELLVCGNKTKSGAWTVIDQKNTDHLNLKNMYQ